MILAPNGKSARQELQTRAPSPPRVNAGYYQAPSTSSELHAYRPRRRMAWKGEVISEWEWAEFLEYSRQIYCQYGNISAAVLQKAKLAVGDAWLPQSLSADLKWRRTAESWLHNQVWPYADVRGPSFDFTSNLFMDSVAMEVDGDSLMILAEAESGFPQAQFLPANTVRTGQVYGGEVQDGQFKGRKISNGTVVDDVGRPLAYRVETETGVQFVDAKQAQLLFEPEMQGQSRGIPRIAKELLSFWSREDIHKFIERGVKLEASVGVLRHTSNGLPPVDTELELTGRSVASGEPARPAFEQVEGGEFWYLNASAGEKVEGFAGTRPHPNVEAFIARLERQAMLAIGWHVELLDPSKVGGASIRAIQNLARQEVRHRQRTIEKRAQRFVKYAVAKGIKIGAIPNNPSPDKWNWTFTRPAELTVDEGYSRAADIEDYKIGSKTLSDLCARAGTWYEDVSAQRDSETVDLITRAQGIADKTGKPFEFVLNLLQQRSPNPPTIANATQDISQL